MKRPFRIGAVVGGIIGVFVALGMDFLLGQNPAGGWSEAVAHDLNRLMKANLSPDSVIVIFGVALVVAFIAAFGAAVGGTFTVLIARLFEALTKED